MVSLYPLTISPSPPDARAFQGFLSQETSPSFGSQPPEAVYPSTLPRSSSAPDLFPQARVLGGYPAQVSMTDSADFRRRSHLPIFNSNHSFQNISPTYEGHQDPSSLPSVHPPGFHRYLEVGTSLYNSPPRIPGFLEPPHGFIETVPTVDPHVLHQVSNHRHSAWDGSSVESTYDNTWVRDQNYRHQVAAYESGGSGYRDNFQYSIVSNSTSLTLLLY